MTSIRYIFLALLYIGGHYFVKYNQNDPDAKRVLIHHPIFIVFFITFIFIYVFKYFENKKCKDKKLPQKYIVSQSVFYGLLALGSSYIYHIFIDKDCVDKVLTIFKKLESFTYIPEAFFIAGIVLLVNQISYLIYPKCEL